MNTNYRFSTLLGSVYRKGNVLFSIDGNSVFSPVGNKISYSHNCSTLPVESMLNVSTMALHPNGSHLFIVNEGGEGQYVNLASQTVLYRHRFHKTVRHVGFSPDQRRLAVCRDGDVQVFLVAGFGSNRYNPFVLEETYKISTDMTTCLAWSDDSRIGSADMQVRICGASQRFMNLFVLPLGGHTSSIVATFFRAQSYDVISIESNGVACCWRCNLSGDDLVKGNPNGESIDHCTMMQFDKAQKHLFWSQVQGRVVVTAAAFHPRLSLLVTGFSSGVFLLHEIGSTFDLIHSLSIGDVSIRSVSINSSGDWLAIAAGQQSIGQLLVWEWQSETYILKQQSHSDIVETIAFSPDGALLASGALDGKVKLWNVRSSFCIVTFAEHQAAVTAVTWTEAGKALLSASLDGTVRAFDLKRYRNFRTLACPETAQLSCLCVDSAGDTVIAGSRDHFRVYIWSLKNGRLLDVLAGHTAPITGISLARTILATVSLDETLRLWNLYGTDQSAEIVQLNDEGLCVAFSPIGNTVAVLCLGGTIGLFDGRNGDQMGSIDTRLDVDSARSRTEMIKRNKSQQSKSFTRIAFSTDGVFLLAGGQSLFVCLYHVIEKILLRKFVLTLNMSLDCVAGDLNRRKLTEFGNIHLIDASDSEEDEADGKKRIKLPGTKHSDLAERSVRPEMRVNDLVFSPTGRMFAVSSTEGVSCYSLDSQLIFDPFQLATDCTPEMIAQLIADGEMAKAMVMALRLNDGHQISSTLLATPIDDVDLVMRSLPLIYADKLLQWLGGGNGGSVMAERHVQLWIKWTRALLFQHGDKLKHSPNLAALTALLHIVYTRTQTLSTLCEENKYALEEIRLARQLHRVSVGDKEEEEEERMNK